MSRIRLVVSVLLFLVTCSAPPGDSGTEIREASGVFRQSDNLLVVDDSALGSYFSVPIAGERGPLIPLQNRPEVDRKGVTRGLHALGKSDATCMADLVDRARRE